MPKPEVTGTIDLLTPNPALGVPVDFAWAVDGKITGNTSEPRIEVLAYQNGELVYGMAWNADAGTVEERTLGAGSSQWLTNGGPAHCVANLYYWQNAPRQTYRLIASTEFEAAG